MVKPHFMDQKNPYGRIVALLDPDILCTVIRFSFSSTFSLLSFLCSRLPYTSSRVAP